MSEFIEGRMQAKATMELVPSLSAVQTHATAQYATQNMPTVPGAF